MAQTQREFLRKRVVRQVPTLGKNGFVSLDQAVANGKDIEAVTWHAQRGTTSMTVHSSMQNHTPIAEQQAIERLTVLALDLADSPQSRAREENCPLWSNEVVQSMFAGAKAKIRQTTSNRCYAETDEAGSLSMQRFEQRSAAGVNAFMEIKRNDGCQVQPLAELGVPAKIEWACPIGAAQTVSLAVGMTNFRVIFMPGDQAQPHMAERGRLIGVARSVVERATAR